MSKIVFKSILDEGLTQKQLLQEVNKLLATKFDINKIKIKKQPEVEEERDDYIRDLETSKKLLNFNKPVPSNILKGIETSVNYYKTLFA